MVICLRMRKTYTTKTPPGDFKVTTPENPLLLKQAVTSKGIPVPYTNLQLNPYPNTQMDLFCSNNISFSMHGSQYMTNQLRGSQYATWSPTWEGCWLQSSSFYHTMKIIKLLGHKTLWCTNIATSSRERRTRAKLGSRLHSPSHYGIVLLCNLCHLLRLLK